MKETSCGTFVIAHRFFQELFTYLNGAAHRFVFELVNHLYNFGLLKYRHKYLMWLFYFDLDWDSDMLWYSFDAAVGLVRNTGELVEEEGKLELKPDLESFDYWKYFRFYTRQSSSHIAVSLGEVHLGHSCFVDFLAY